MEYVISYHIMTLAIFVGIVVTMPEPKAEFHCPDNLSLKLGRTNFIDCNIPTHYQSIFWYSPDEGFMTSFSNGEKGGNGYKSGHFDILADGTFVIYNTDIDDLGTYYVGVTYSDHVVQYASILITHNGTHELDDFDCASPQFLRIGRAGFIHCNIPPGFLSIFWSHSLDDIQSSSAFIDNGEKGGNAYNSGHFDVLENGALVINNVAVDDEGQYQVDVIDRTASVKRAQIIMHATATPDQKHPFISLCGKRDQCLKTSHNRVNLSCSFHKSRPAVDLRWFTWVSNGINELNTTQVISVENNQLHSTRTNLLMSESSNLFDMYSCRASGPPLSPATVESFIVIHNTQITSKFQGVQIEPVILLLYGSASLSCHKTENVTSAIVLWKAGKSFSTLKEIAHSYYIVNHRQRYSKAELMFDDHTGNIKVRDVTQKDHGTMYVCFSNVDGREAATAYSIFVIVPPSPPYIRIDGCRDTVSSCQTRGREGKIVCKVSNVFPSVTLQPSSTPPDRVKFTNIQQKEEKNGDNYDITLVFNYTVGSTFCNVNVPITCTAVGEPALTFSSQRDVFVKANCVTSANWSDEAIAERADFQPYNMSSLKTTVHLTMIITCVVTVLFITYILCYNI